MFDVFVVKIENPEWLVSTKRLTLTRSEFTGLPGFSRCPNVTVPEYKKDSKGGRVKKAVTGKKVFNKSLYIAPIEIYGVLANLEDQCLAVPKLWYFVLASLLSRTKEDPLLNDDYVHYGKQLLCTSTTELNKTVSLTQCTLWVWPISLSVAKLNELFVETGRLFNMARRLHKQTVGMLKTYNGSITNKKVSDSVINMAFFKGITEKFPTPNSVLQSNEESIKDGAETFKKIIEFYENDYEEELQDYFRHEDSGVMISNPVKQTSLAAYEIARTEEALSKTKTGRERQLDAIALNASVVAPVGLMKTLNLPLAPLINLWSRQTYAYSGKLAFDEITKPPFPVGCPFVVKLPDQKGKQIRNAYITNVNEFDKPFLVDKVYRAVLNFLDEPTMQTYMKYAMAMVSIIDKNEYCWHEKMVQGNPAHRMILDVDANDIEFIRYITNSEKRMERKFEFRQKMIDIVQRAFGIIGLGNDVKGRFTLYESMGITGEEIKKLGFRFVVVLEEYVFLSVGVVSKFAELINLLMEQDTYFPGPCIDLNVYANGSMRLPMNSKTNKKSHLIPLLMDRKRCDFCPSNGLCHLPPSDIGDRKVRVISYIPSIDESSTTKKLSDLHIIETTMENKFSKSGDVITGDYANKIREFVLPVVVELYKDRGFDVTTFLRVSKQSVFKQNYSLTKNEPKLYGVCLNKKHSFELGNPIIIACDLYQSDGQIRYKVAQMCYGSECGWSPVTSGILGQ